MCIDYGDAGVIGKAKRTGKEVVKVDGRNLKIKTVEALFSLHCFDNVC